MIHRKILLTAVVAAITVFGATLAFGQTSNCPAGNSGSTDYCASNSNSDDPPPATPPQTEPPQSGQPATVAGTLNGGTTTLEVPASSNGPGTADLAVNLAGAGTLVLHAGDQTITITVAGDGTTTIVPAPGQPGIVLSGANSAPGTVRIQITPQGVTYTLESAGQHTITVGGTQAVVPSGATITTSGDTASYHLVGQGACTADLDPNFTNTFVTGANIGCTINGTPTPNTSTRSRRATKVHRDVIRTGNHIDKIKGSPGPDVIRSGGGNDVVNGLRGNDVIYAGAGKDRIRSVGGGRDTIHCGSGVDTVVADRSDHVGRDCEHVKRVRH